MIGFGLEDNKTSWHPQIFMVWFPGVALLYRSFIDYNLINWQSMLKLPAVSTLIAMLYFVARFEAVRKNIKLLLLVPVMVFCYFTGIMRIANVQLDDSKPEIFPVAVTGLHVSGDSGSRSYYVTVEAWGATPHEQEFYVHGDFYHSLHVGDKVCVYMGSGRLGFRWYELGSCRPKR